MLDNAHLRFGSDPSHHDINTDTDTYTYTHMLSVYSSQFAMLSILIQSNFRSFVRYMIV